MGVVLMNIAGGWFACFLVHRRCRWSRFIGECPSVQDNKTDPDIPASKDDGPCLEQRPSQAGTQAEPQHIGPDGERIARQTPLETMNLHSWKPGHTDSSAEIAARADETLCD